MKWKSILSLALCFAGTIAEAQLQRDAHSGAPPGAKAPWEWTASERAQARRDPLLQRERVAAFAAKQRTQPQGRSAEAVSPGADVIDGSRNPELYFTTELFEILVRSSFVTLPDAYPHVVRQRTSDLFTTAEDWDRFRAITSDYADVIRQEKEAAEALDSARVSELQELKCAAAARAIREARRAFGRTRFDRMLYETVPPSMKTFFSADTDFQLSVGKAQEREERCQ